MINRFNARILALYCVFSTSMGEKNELDSAQKFFADFPSLSQDLEDNLSFSLNAYSEIEQMNVRFMNNLVEETRNRLDDLVPLIHARTEKKKPLAKLEEILEVN